MENLSSDLIEVILSFVQTKDVKNFGLICKNYLATTKECQKLGWMYTIEISNCQHCQKFDLYPIIVNLKVANRERKNKNFVLCSKKCRYYLFHNFPRCNFCFSTVTYEDRIEQTLFCSDICTEYSAQHIPRESYLI